MDGVPVTCSCARLGISFGIKCVLGQCLPGSPFWRGVLGMEGEWLWLRNILLLDFGDLGWLRGMLDGFRPGFENFCFVGE